MVLTFNHSLSDRIFVGGKYIPRSIATASGYTRLMWDSQSMELNGFDEAEWTRKMLPAKTGKELMAVTMELPERPLHETIEEDREFFITEPEIESQILTFTTKTAKTRTD